MVRVGVERPRDEVLKYTRDYLSGNGKWAHPAYASYAGTPGGMVGDADLLAVYLLNASQQMNPAPLRHADAAPQRSVQSPISLAFRMRGQRPTSVRRCS